MKSKKATRKLWQWGAMMLSIVSFLSLMMAPIGLFAKVSVSKSKITISKFSGFSSQKDVYVLACEGHYTWITTDAAGNTQVYVNESTNRQIANTYLKTDTWRVELPEGVTWDRVIIYGGKDQIYGDSRDNYDINIKMDGGCVSDINLGPVPCIENPLLNKLIPYQGDIKNVITGKANLTITGGTVYSIGELDAVNGVVNIYMDNVNYSGPNKIEIPENKSNLNIFINNNCTFYAPSAKLEPSDVTGCNGAFIPSNASLNSKVMRAYGAAVLPEGYIVNCSSFTVANTLTISGELNVYASRGIISPTGVSGNAPNIYRSSLPDDCSHEYQIKSIDYVSPHTPEEGLLTMECTICHKKYPYFPFNLMYVSPGLSNDNLESGYWVKSVPVETLELPTCIPGRGIYQITLNYLGQKMTKKYENIIRPNGHIHNYGEDGVCHETHYKLYYKEDQPGVMIKDGMGNIVYDADDDDNVTVDNTTKRAVAYVAKAKQVPYLRSDGFPYVDPEVSLNRFDIDYPLTYTDWEVTTFNTVTPDGFNKAIDDALAAGETIAIGFFRGVQSLPANTAFCTSDPNIAFIMPEGFKLTTTFDDATAYTRTTSFGAAELAYTRECTEALAGKWQALMVPFPIEMTEEVLEQCDIAELYMISTKGSTNGGINEGGQDQPNVAVLTKFELGQSTPASTPLFIRPKQAGTLSIVQKDVEVKAANISNTVRCSTTKDSYELHGVYNGTFTVPSDGNAYYAPYNGSITLFTGGLTHANRWYMKKESLSQQNQSMARANIMMHTFGEDNEDGLNDLDFIEEAAQNSSCTYDIYGREVKDGQQLSPGFYIKNHKKILIK